MANTVDKVLAIAEAEVGYLEKATGDTRYLYSKTANAGSANYTKYGYEMHQVYPATMDYPAFWCFTQGTMVLTDYGYVDISMLRIGDRVLSADGTHFNTVVNVMAHEDDIYELRAIGTLPTYSTKDHPYVAKKRLHVRKDAGFSETQFFPVGELKKGDAVAMCMTKIMNNVNLSYNDAWLIGYYVGDGWDSNGKYFICGNDKKCEKIETYVSGLFKEPMYNTRTCQQYVLTEQQAHLFNILNECGHGAANKRVPASILYANNNIKQAFLDGYLSADGISTGTRFNSISKELVFGICKLATDLGYGTSMYLQKRDYEYTYYDERYDRDRKIICSDLYYGNINNSDNPRNRSHDIIEGYSFHTVKSVENTGFRDIVYNITTDGDHTYVANNMSVHNCDCFVDWCFYKAYGVSNAKALLGGNFDDYTIASVQLYKNKGAWIPRGTQLPKPGDQIFFNNGREICHTGLVYAVSGLYVYTIEGNTSGGSTVVANGGSVVKKCYLLSNTRISGYGRPKYDTVTKTTTTKKVATPKKKPNVAKATLKQGSKGTEVKRLQKDLNYLGLAALNVDSEFGPKTAIALKVFQKKYNLVADGIYGPKSEAKMKAVLK